MSVVLPYSMDLTKSKSSLNADVEPNLHRVRSDGLTYGGSDTMSFTIPTSNSSQFLHPKESFIELKFKPTFTAGSGASVYIDSNAYALFDAVRVYHGSQLLFGTNNVAPLWIALRDCVTDARGDSLDILTHPSSTAAGGHIMTTNYTYPISFCLPISVLGSMAGDHSIPLDLANAGDLVLELDLNPVAKVLCNRLSTAVGAGSTASTLTSYQLSDCYFNMKTSRLPSQISQALKMSYGDMVRFSGQSWASERVSIPAGSTSISARLPFRFSSLKGIVWFLQNSAIANGTIVGTNYEQAVGHRTGGRLNQYWVSIDGRDYPNSHVSVGYGSATIDGGQGFYSSFAYSQLKRFLNNLPNGYCPTSLHKENYALVANDDTAIQASAYSPKFVGALDLDRSDQSTEEIYQGINTRNANINFNATFDAALTDTMTLCIYGLYDISYEIRDGQITPYF